MDNSPASNVREQLAILNSRREALGLPTPSNLDIDGLQRPTAPINEKAHLPVSSQVPPIRVTEAAFNGMRTLPLPIRSDRNTMTRISSTRPSAANGRVRKGIKVSRSGYPPHKIYLHPCSPPPGYDSRGKRLGGGNSSLPIIEANPQRTATESSENTETTSDDEPGPLLRRIQGPHVDLQAPGLAAGAVSVCVVCHDYRTRSTNDLRNHMRRVHADNPINGSHKCGECGLRYKHRGHLMRHAKVTGHQAEILESA